MANGCRKQNINNEKEREAANTDRLCADLTMMIQKVHWIRQMLQARFDLPVDGDL